MIIVKVNPLTNISGHWIKSEFGKLDEKLRNENALDVRNFNHCDSMTVNDVNRLKLFQILADLILTFSHLERN